MNIQIAMQLAKKSGIIEGRRKAFGFQAWQTSRK
jgi:hypothetical protein